MVFKSHTKAETFPSRKLPFLVTLVLIRETAEFCENAGLKQVRYNLTRAPLLLLVSCVSLFSIVANVFLLLR
jgi:hypothetical protein